MQNNKISDADRYELTDADQKTVLNFINTHPYSDDSFINTWDGLMEVVEEIEKLELDYIDEEEDDDRYKERTAQFTVDISGYQCVIHRDVLPQYHGTWTDFLKLYDCRNRSKIKAVQYAIVKFINWYNEQPKLNFSNNEQTI